jgi:CheY-like chemotaxis protein
VIEPDPHAHPVLASLAADGHELLSAETGPEAVESMDRRAPDVVLVDLALPRVALFTVLRRIRAFDPQPPVIGVCHRDAGRPNSHGDISCYVFRPFHVPSLLTAVRRTLGLDLQPRRESPPRRAHRRCNVVLDAQLVSRDGQRLGQGRIVNLSAGGAQPHVDFRLAVGLRMFVGFRLPSHPTPVTLPARVQWRNPATQGFAFGVQFEEVAPDVDRVLKEVVDSLRSG